MTVAKDDPPVSKRPLAISWLEQAITEAGTGQDLPTDTQVFISIAYALLALDHTLSTILANVEFDTTVTEPNETPSV